MKFFSIPTIKGAIERLQFVSANWILPAFVFAANDVGTEELVDLSQRLGTDQFLDRYFNGSRISIPAFPDTGNNLLRPRMAGIRWDRGPFAGDHLVRQDTKMWGNLFSSRGYREMRLEGLIQGEKAINRLTDAFASRFEQEVAPNFNFEDFLVWLYAFEGFPDAVSGWPDLFRHLLEQLHLTEFKEPYRARFKLSEPPIPWPVLIDQRPSDNEFLSELAPKLKGYLENTETRALDPSGFAAPAPLLSRDDPMFAEVDAAINTGESLAFLLAGPPGTGKTRYARQLALTLTGNDPERLLFIQFHPAIGYDDFIEGFRPATTTAGSGVRYELAPRLFLKFAKSADERPDLKFVAVIDELNRGDVARIFGEVLTYLEPDYRGLSFTLPISGNKVSIPNNLILIATANPFDRSVTDLDDALLRRFRVMEMIPDPSLLQIQLQRKGVDEGVINRTLQMFKILNDSMPNGFGHASFMRVQSVEDLAAVWTGRVRLGLRRAFVHDRSAFDAVVAKIEPLLSLREPELD